MGVPDFCARWRAFNALQVAVGAEVSVASMLHRTCPVNYSGAPLDFPEGDEFDWESSDAPDTVRWCTGHCPVAHRTVRCARPEEPSVDPSLFC
jgi:hypothetical protein